MKSVPTKLKKSSVSTWENNSTSSPQWGQQEPEHLFPLEEPMTEALCRTKSILGATVIPEAAG